MHASAPAPSLVPDESARLQLLQSIATVMGASAPVREALEQVLEEMRRTLPILRGSITLISPATGEIRIEASCGLKDAERLRGRYARGEGVTGRVIQTGQAMCIPDAAEEPLFLNRTGSRDLEHEAIAVLCVPILLAGQAVGALAVDRQPADAATLGADMNLLRIIACVNRKSHLFPGRDRSVYALIAFIFTVKINALLIQHFVGGIIIINLCDRIKIERHCFFIFKSKRIYRVLFPIVCKLQITVGSCGKRHRRAV